MKKPEEHPWIVLRVRLGDAGWFNHQQTFATEEEARVAHEVPFESHEAVSQLLQWKEQDDGTWKLEDVHVRRSS